MFIVEKALQMGFRPMINVLIVNDNIMPLLSEYGCKICDSLRKPGNIRIIIIDYQQNSH
jgi:hypothetical protein